MKIRHKIALWVASAGFLTSLVFSLFVFFEMNEQTLDMMDSQLKTMADEVAGQLNATQTPSKHTAENSLLIFSKHAWIKVFDQNLHVVYQSALTRIVDLPLYKNKKSSYTISANIPRDRIFLDQDDENEVTFKILVVKKQINGESCLIHVAKPIEDIEEELLDAYTTVGIGLFLSTLLLVFLSYAMAGRILKPLSDINRLAREIDENTLEKRIPTGKSHDELHELVTHLNHMFDRLQFSFVRQKQLLADASHELKSPLAMLRFFFEEASQHQNLPEPFYNQLNTQEQNVLRMDRLVRALLELSVLEIKASLVSETFDLIDMIRSIIGDFKPIMEKADIRLETDLPDNLAFRGDKDRLRRALINVLDNAITYNVAHGRIQIFLTNKENMIILSLSNTGPGIPQSDLPRVFDQFYRVEKSRSTAHGGAGLGLSIVREIVRLHKGSVTIDSLTNQWTRVKIILPLHSEG